MINLEKYEEKDPLIEQSILKYVTDEQIISHYLGDIETNKAIISPIREESSPSFSIFYSKRHNRIMFFDHATGDKGTFVRLICLMYNVDWKTALSIVVKDLGLSDKIKIDDGNYPKERKLAEKKGSSIKLSDTTKRLRIKSRSWQKRDELYWSQYGISKKTLINYKVKPVDYVFIGKDKVFKAEKISYAYLEEKNGEKRYKLYQPFSKVLKWYSDFIPNTLSGYEQLPKNGDILFITSSLKDGMCLYELGYNFISPQSENHVYKDSLISELKERFNNIVVFYDSDEKGREFSQKLCKEFSLYSIDTDSIYKDISDYFKKYGKNETIDLIKKKLKNVIL